MRDLDHDIHSLENRLGQICERIRRNNACLDDRVLIERIEKGTAGPAEVAQYARILAPAVRSQLITCALWRSDVELRGGSLPFSPVLPMHVVVELCSVPAEAQLPRELLNDFTLMLKHNPEFWKRITNQWMARSMYLHWVEATVLQVAAGSTDCLAVRQIIDHLYDHPDAEAPVEAADDRAVDLAAPLRSPTDRLAYRLVSQIGSPFA